MPHSSACPPQLATPTPGRTRSLLTSTGFDPVLCGLGSGLGGDLITSGLRVPTLPGNNGIGGGASPNAGPYLFQLCTAQVGYGEKVWLVGLSQTLEIGVDTADGAAPVYPLTKLVGRAGSGNPLWSFADGWTSWHVRLVRNVPQVPWAGQNPLSTDSFAWRWSTSPALVFETATFAAAHLSGSGTPDNYVALTGYTPPYGGHAIGNPVGGDLSGFTELRFPVDDPAKQSIDPILVEGPGALVFWAKVWQTNVETRPDITVPAMFPLDPAIPEEAFVAAWPAAVYWRVGGSMVIERCRGW